MKKQSGKVKKDDAQRGFLETFSPFAHPVDKFAISHWYIPIFGPYVLSKIFEIPIWIRIKQPVLGFGEDKFHLLFAIALVLVVLAFRKWLSLIPRVMTAFLAKDLIASKPGDNTAPAFLGYLEKYQQMLHSQKRFLLIIPFLLLTGLILFKMATDTSDATHSIAYYVIQSRDIFAILTTFCFYVLSGFVWAYFAGVAAWILSVTGWFLWRLPNEFEIRVQPNHPDECGGLRFIGNFCFRMVVPILLGAIFLGVVSLAEGILDASAGLRLGSNLALLIVGLPLTYITFFTPMWGIHTEMQKRKAEFEEDLASHLLKLDSRAKSLLKQENFEEAKKTLEELNSIKTSSSGKFPVWPFDLAILARFLTPQLVPVLSFTFGIKKEEYIKILEYLLNLK